MITLVDLDSPGHVEHTVDPVAEGAEALFGWERKPEGLCRDDVCIPVPPGPLALADVATALRRPLVVDTAAGVAAIGASWTERGAALRAGTAPDFTLPDLAGREWTLAQFRGRKVVLYAYASW